jgi:HD superfamily phosphohydrolase
MRPRGDRTYHDPLHGAITLSARDTTEALLIQLIDTPAFQRLRRIRQLGTASLTFHGAEGSRFTHSLGVMAVARQVCDRLIAAYPELQPYRTVVLVGALLHDIGHGPFSHTGEDIFQSNHEVWTLRILKEFQPVASLLHQFSSSLIPELAQIYDKDFALPLAWQLVSSQLDCDRLDYLMRDSYFTGAAYGNLDLDRILLALDYDPVSRQLVVIRKGLAAIEHYLVVRSFMYSQVYNHPKNIAAAWVLEQAFVRAKALLIAGKITADSTVTAWLSQPQSLSLEQYLAADDIVFTYHLQVWRSSRDLQLADLCRRYLDRDLLKALDISHLPADQQADLQTQAQQLARQAGFDPVAYIGKKVAHSRGYTLYQRGINLQTSQGLKEISDISPLVRTLTQPQERVLLLYPREIEEALKGKV